MSSFLTIFEKFYHLDISGVKANLAGRGITHQQLSRRLEEFAFRSPIREGSLEIRLGIVDPPARVVSRPPGR